MLFEHEIVVCGFEIFETIPSKYRPRKYILFLSTILLIFFYLLSFRLIHPVRFHMNTEAIDRRCSIKRVLKISENQRKAHVLEYPF